MLKTGTIPKNFDIISISIVVLISDSVLPHVANLWGGEANSYFKSKVRDDLGTLMKPDCSPSYGSSSGARARSVQRLFLIIVTSMFNLNYSPFAFFLFF